MLFGIIFATTAGDCWYLPNKLNVVRNQSFCLYHVFLNLVHCLTRTWKYICFFADYHTHLILMTCRLHVIMICQVAHHYTFLILPNYHAADYWQFSMILVRYFFFVCGGFLPHWHHVIRDEPSEYIWFYFDWLGLRLYASILFVCLGQTSEIDVRSI